MTFVQRRLQQCSTLRSRRGPYENQFHLVAIVGRASVSESVTSALIDRGNADVTLKVIGNEGARFSDTAFAKLTNRGHSDKNLAAALALRKDLPQELRPFLGLPPV